MFLAQLVDIAALNSDRYIVGLAGLSKVDLTIYVVHLRFAGVINLLLFGPLAFWFPVQAMKRNTLTDRDFFNAVLVLVVSLILPIIIIVQLASTLLWPLLFPQVPLDHNLLLACAAVVSLQGFTTVVTIGLLRPGHTKWAIVPSAVYFALVLTLGFAFTHLYGLMGLAFGRVLAAAGLVVTIWVISHRIAPVRHSLVGLTPFGLAIAALCFFPEALREGLIGPAADIAVVLACVCIGLWLHRNAIRTTFAP